MNRKGISLIVSWVLLVGIGLALGLMVTQWSRDQAEKSSEQLVTDVSSELLCNEVSFNVVFDQDCEHLLITNKGYHKITHVTVRGKAGGPTLTVSLGPGETQPLNIEPYSQEIASSGVQTEFIPSVAGEQGTIPCAHRKIIAECPYLP